MKMGVIFERGYVIFWKKGCDFEKKDPLFPEGLGLGPAAGKIF